LECGRYAGGMPSLWCELFQSALKTSGLNIRKFATLVKSNKSTVSHYSSGRTAVPVEILDAWCDTLKIHGQDRRRFIDMAAMTHVPESVRERYEKWLDEHYAMKAELAKDHREARRAAEKGPPYRHR
jgi:hypothetical protein